MADLNPDAEIYAAAKDLTATLAEIAQQLDAIILAPIGQVRDRVAWLDWGAGGRCSGHCAGNSQRGLGAGPGA